MKFLIDAQLPKSLCLLLEEKGFDSIHTIDLPDKNASSDQDIIAISKSQNRVIITKDHDFLDSFMVKSQPEKLIIIKTGNISNTSLSKIFEHNLKLIVEMLSRSNLIEINKEEIIEHE